MASNFFSALAGLGNVGGDAAQGLFGGAIEGDRYAHARAYQQAQTQAIQLNNQLKQLEMLQYQAQQKAMPFLPALLADVNRPQITGTQMMAPPGASPIAPGMGAYRPGLTSPEWSTTAPSQFVNKPGAPGMGDVMGRLAQAPPDVRGPVSQVIVPEFLKARLATLFPKPVDPDLAALHREQAYQARSHGDWWRAQIPFLGQKGAGTFQDRVLAEWQRIPGNENKNILDFIKEEATAKQAPARAGQDVSLDVRTQLKAMGVDPAKATDTQIQTALDAVNTTMEKRAGMTAQARVDVTTAAKTAQQEHAFASSETLLNQLDALLPMMKAKGFFAANPSSKAGLASRARRSEWNPIYGQAGDPVLTAWLTHEGTMIAIQRQLGDIGGRFKGAYESAMKIITSPYVTHEGAQRALGQLRDAVTAYKTGKAAEYEAGTWNRISPPGPAAPAAPKAAPGPAPSGAAPAGKRAVIGPDGVPGYVPADTDLTKYPGYRWQ